MTHTLTVTFSGPEFAALERVAKAADKEPAAFVADVVRDQLPPPDGFPPQGGGDIRRFFGAIRGSTRPGMTNEEMDAVLAAEYGSTHETP